MKNDFELFKQFIIENDLETDLGLKDFLYGNDVYENYIIYIKMIYLMIINLNLKLKT